MYPLDLHILLRMPLSVPIITNIFINHPFIFMSNFNQFQKMSLDKRYHSGRALHPALCPPVGDSGRGPHPWTNRAPRSRTRDRGSYHGHNPPKGEKQPPPGEGRDHLVGQERPKMRNTVRPPQDRRAPAGMQREAPGDRGSHKDCRRHMCPPVGTQREVPRDRGSCKDCRRHMRQGSPKHYRCAWHVVG